MSEEQAPDQPETSTPKQEEQPAKENLLFRVANHVIDWNNFRIRSPYAGLAKGIYKKVARKVNESERIQKITNDIKVRFIDDKPNDKK